MNRDDIIRMAGHREVPPWVLKLVMDCVEAEREKDTALLRQCLDSLILGAAIYQKESSIRPVFDTAITALLALLEGEQ